MKKHPVLAALVKAFLGIIILGGLRLYDDVWTMVFALVLGLALIFWAVWPFIRKYRKRGQAAKAEQPVFVAEGSAGEGDVEYSYTRISDREALRLKDFVVLDTETTGVSARDHKIIELAAVKVKDGQRTGFYTLVNPQRRIPLSATQIHGITDADVKDAPVFAQVAPALDAFLEDLPVIGHNATFDLRFLAWEYHDSGLEISPKRYVDTLLLARKAFPGRPDYKLASLIRDYSLIDGEQAHRAESDADATLALYELCREQMTAKK